MTKQASKKIRMMGTNIDLMVVHEEPKTVLGEMVERLKIYEQRFSANDDLSELSTVNQQAGVKPIKVHPELFSLIKLGKEHSVAPNSFLNIAIGPLVQTWRIGFDNARVPSNDEVQKLLQITNSKEILLDEEASSVYLKQKNMKIDLGALAKGYIADRLIEYLKKVNAKSALINLGGNLVTYGPALNRPDNLWRVGIQNPAQTRGQSQIILKVANKSVVTSGIYERQLKKNEQTFHHIFDPQTGYPMETKLASLTIVSDLSVDGEIWTTRLFGLAPDEIIQQLNESPNIEGLVITKDGQVKVSKNLQQSILKL